MPRPLGRRMHSTTPTGAAANSGFSVTTNYIFLFKIGKTCAKY